VESLPLGRFYYRRAFRKGITIATYNLDTERLRIARPIAQESAFRDYSDELKRGKGISKGN
jgi:hypothetical protein